MRCARERCLLFGAAQHERRNTSGANLDMSAGGDGSATPVNACSVPPESTSIDAQQCTQSAPAASFTPHVKWTWTAPGNDGTVGSIVMPLVGNFTDDNGDGVVDLCDTPDVLVTTGDGSVGATGHIYMLAGDTGKLEHTFEGIVDGSVTPAFGDIDGDGSPEIIANDVAGHLVAYDHLGKLKWVGPSVGAYKNVSASYCHAIAIYDLDRFQIEVSL